MTFLYNICYLAGLIKSQTFERYFKLIFIKDLALPFLSWPGSSKNQYPKQTKYNLRQFSQHNLFLVCHSSFLEVMTKSTCIAEVSRRLLMWWSEADSMRNWIQVRSWATRAFRSNPFKDKRMKNKILTETEKEP